MVEVANAKDLLCILCGAKHEQARTMYQHHVTRHGSEWPWHVKCMVKDCQAPLLKFESWQKIRMHFTKKHGMTTMYIEDLVIYQDRTPGSSTGDISPNVNDRAREKENEDLHEDREHCEEPVEAMDSDTVNEEEQNPQDSNTNINKLVMHIMLTVSELESKYQMSYVGQQFVFDKMRDVVKLLCGDLSRQNGALEAVATKYKRRQYQQKQMWYIQPKSLDIDNNFVDRKGRIKTVTCQYTDMAEAIQQSLKNKEVLKWVLEGSPPVNHPDGGGVIYDGREKVTWEDGQVVIPVQLSYDEVEVCNPIGSAKVKHKVGVCFMDILSIPPEERSIIETKRMLFVVRSRFISKNKRAWKRVWANIVETITRSWEEGLKLVEGSHMKFKIFISRLVCDHLAAHQVLNMMEAMGRMKYPCRFCTIHRRQTKTKFLSAFYDLRTHEKYMKELKDFRLGKVEAGNIFKEQPVLVDICTFGPWSLPVDVLHTVLEGGILSLEFSLFIRYVTATRKFIEWKLLNKLIEEYDFPKSRDKPTTLPDKLRKPGAVLQMKAAEFYALAEAIVFILADFVPSDDPYLLNYCKTLQLSQLLLFAPVINEDGIQNMNIHISTRMYDLQLLYPNTTMRMKGHSLTHIDEQIRMFGSTPRGFETIRFESAYSRIKKKTYRNHINIAKTIAEHMETLHMMDTIKARDRSVLLRRVSYFGFADDCESEILEYMKTNENLQGVRPNEVAIVGYIIKNGTRFERGNVLELSHPTEMEPKFAEIKEIVVVNEQVFLCLDKWKTVEFTHHVCAYKVSDREKIVVDFESIDYKLLCPKRYLGDDIMITRKHTASLVWYKIETEHMIKKTGKASKRCNNKGQGENSTKAKKRKLYKD